jgi:3-deoxy-D-manno-octulosonic-acid transferase
MKLFYQIFVLLYGGILQGIALFNRKAKAWVAGRQHLFPQLSTALAKEKSPIIWFHCASLGEFEQGRPIIEQIKLEDPQYKILLTFFSPSGFEIRKHYEQADFVFYLPLDTKKNAAQFLDIVQPKMVFFIKYEFWFNFLTAIQNRQIPLFLIAGVFRKEQFFFKSYAQSFLKIIRNFDYLFVQKAEDAELLTSFSFSNFAIVGDPRIDRVASIAAKVQAIPIIEQFKGNANLFVIGSSHAKDEILLNQFLKQCKTTQLLEDWQVVIFPHEIGEKAVQGLLNRIDFSMMRYSSLENNTLPDLIPKILIMDTMGMLNKAYQYADMTYIGGGFDSSIHNILEPAVFGMPLFFGPNYQKFAEANDLVKLKGAFSIATATDLMQLFEQFQNEAVRAHTSQITADYIQENKGATQKIFSFLKNNYQL